MAISVKISQLLDGGSLNSSDYFPVSRGSIETYKIAATKIVTAGANIGIGTGQIFKSGVDGAGRTLTFRSLSGADGLSVANVDDTLVISASGQNPVKTSRTGNGITTSFSLETGAFNSINPNNYRVDIDGILQEPGFTYNIVGSNIVFTAPPPNNGKITVVSNNLVRAYDIIPSDGSVTANKLAPDALVPTGAIMMFYRSTAPTGWLICDGSAIPTQFAALISLVGANTPNLRGMFIRGWSPSTTLTSRDPLSGSRTLGSIQDDAFKSHRHTDAGASGTLGTFGPNAGYATLNTTETGFTGDVETRPVNIALLYCIKT